MGWGLMVLALVVAAGSGGLFALANRVTRAKREQWHQLARHLEGKLERLAWYSPWRLIRTRIGAYGVEVREAPPGQHTPGGVELRVSAPFGCSIQFWPRGTVVVLSRLQRVAVDEPLAAGFDVYTDNPARASLLLCDARKRATMARLLDEGALRIQPDQARLSCTDYRPGPGRGGVPTSTRGKLLENQDTLLALLDGLRALG
jgi:hypothetical protein